MRCRPSLQSEPPVRELCYLHWGLIPSWATDPKIGYGMINARSETLAVKPAFRGPFKTSRCIIPIDGFYEWKSAGKVKQPFFIRRRDERMLLLAGLWTSWRSPAGEVIESCCIITTTANEVLRPIHDRMPVILPEQELDRWLDTRLHDTAELQKLLVPAPAEELVGYPVSTRANNPRNDDANCIVEIPWADVAAG